MKRLVVCCDGTWNIPDRTDAKQVCPSNVTKLALTFRDRDAAGVEQRLFYGKGVGTGVSDRLRGGMFGWGLSCHILNAYRFLCEHYQPGDELFLFGFSRGAYTARSLAGLIRNSGLLMPDCLAKVADAYALYRRRDCPSHPNENEARLFRKAYAYEPHITFIGVWDTVGALGIPMPVPWLRFVNRRWQFHDVKLSSYVDNAYQALAIDEHRHTFLPTLWEQQPHATHQHLEQVWFAGVHTDIGGGYVDSALSDITFLWMQEKAEACGLAFDEDALWRLNLRPCCFGTLHDSRRGIFRILPAAERRLGASKQGHEAVHASAVERTERTGYRPANLETYLAQGGVVTADRGAGAEHDRGDEPVVLVKIGTLEYERHSDRQTPEGDHERGRPDPSRGRAGRHGP